MSDRLSTYPALIAARRLGFQDPLPGEGKRTPRGLTWRELQDVRTSHADRKRWGKQYPTCASVVALCGAVHGIYVLDIDRPDAEECLRSLPGVAEVLDATACWTTPHGIHYGLAPPGGHLLRLRNFDGYDFKGERSLTVIPPTPGYSMVRPMERLRAVPEALVELVGTARERRAGKRPLVDGLPRSGYVRRDDKGALWHRTLTGMQRDLEALEDGRHNALQEKAWRFGVHYAATPHHLRECLNVFMAASETNGLVRDRGESHVWDVIVRNLRDGFLRAQDEQETQR